MLIKHWNQMDRELDHLVRGLFFNDSARPSGRFQEARYLAPADVVETEDAFLVKVDLPGHDPKSINVQLEKDLLTLTSERKAETRQEKDSWLRAERTYGTFSRSFKLPTNVDPQGITASYENGVLAVSLPKRAEEKPRTIEVKVG